MKTDLNLKSIMIIGVMSVAALGASAQNEKRPTTTTKTDVEVRTEVKYADSDVAASYVVEAYKSGLKEIKKSKKVNSYTQSAEIKRLSEMMVTDHTALNNQLRELAASENIALPTDTENSDDYKKSADYDKSKADKAEMALIEKDRVYVDKLVDSHKKSVALFEKGAKVEDAEIRAVFVAALPKIKHHLEMAVNLQNNMKEKGTDKSKSSNHHMN